MFREVKCLAQGHMGSEGVEPAFESRFVEFQSPDSFQCFMELFLLEGWPS